MSAPGPLHTPGDSENELTPEAPLGSTVKKRSSRACDRCRKTKNKCEPAEEGSACKSCTAAGIDCTFLGPTHKRGPPKGYIHALEQRWYLAESMLGAVLASPDPRAQAVISTLRQDALAREVLNKIDIGPFGSTGRAMNSSFPSMEDLFYGEQTVPQPHGPARANRQSRVSREFVSFVQDRTMTPEEVSQWRDHLGDLLSTPTQSNYSPLEPRSSTSSSSQYQNPEPGASSSEPPAQKRRLDDSFSVPEGRPDFSRMYTMDPAPNATEASWTSDDEGSEAFGQLSLDEKKEVRYHGKASGLHLLGRNERTDDFRAGGIWNFPLARALLGTSPPADSEEFNVKTPDLKTQQRLLDLYFAYINPTLPVIHKPLFLKKFESGSVELSSQTGTRIWILLLLAIFSVSETILSSKEKSESDSHYFADAMKILRRNVEHSQPLVCKALLLIGLHEIAMGSPERAWLYIGIAIRMAQDLGLNRAADNWRLGGSEMFSAVESGVRKRIWWSCCIAEAHICSFLGRPMSIGRNDSDLELPEVDKEEDEELWPVTEDGDAPHEPVQSNTSSCFRHSASLSMIVSDIIRNMYPVRQSANGSKRASLTQLQSNLSQWYNELPQSLRYEKSKPPAPHVFLLNVQYWSAILLLNRACLPSRMERKAPTSSLFAHDYTGRSPVTVQCLDACQSSAAHISTLVDEYRIKYGLQRTSPILIPYIQSAGIMHAATLMLRKSNKGAYLGWSQCLAALDEMKSVWPSAHNAWQLLNGVKLRPDDSLGPSMSVADPPTHYRAVHEGTASTQTGATHGQQMPGDTADAAQNLGDMLGVEYDGDLGQFYSGYEGMSADSSPPWAPWSSTFFQPGIPMGPSPPPGYQEAPDPALVHTYTDREGNMYFDPSFHGSRSFDPL
ncbi:hypothetical protein OE88DRAFT_1736281 [Heliocybe sulcata]|uniref:Zn(2)-C6 fungal-type domain-containing protein n=1 Tax=Heliocybe sulcata TaxID=5364 RepID=A0A5C3MYG6_9AGAM|nr:hypothetical protein OE88DRAFT_1736281 [Heliocybe sulcata]